MKTKGVIPMPTSAAAKDLYSLELIEKMCRGNIDLIKEMLQVFAEDLPKAVEEIKSAYQIQDFKIIKNTAHRIKPVLKFYNVEILENDILAMEQIAERQVLSGELEELIKKMDTVASLIVADITNTLLAA